MANQRRLAKVQAMVPASVMDRLKRRAKAEQRSVAAEVRRIILRALEEEEAESA